MKCIIIDNENVNNIRDINCIFSFNKECWYLFYGHLRSIHHC